MTETENILGFDFKVYDDYINTEVCDPSWLDSESFSKLRKSFERKQRTELIKIKSDVIFVHKSCILEFIRYHDYEKYIIMIDNATDNYFDSGKIIPVVKKETVFSALREFISI